MSLPVGDTGNDRSFVQRGGQDKAAVVVRVVAHDLHPPRRQRRRRGLRPKPARVGRDGIVYQCHCFILLKTLPRNEFRGFNKAIVHLRGHKKSPRSGLSAKADICSTEDPEFIPG